MCNYSGKLIAWLDHELAETAAVDVERHVGECAECRRAVHSYQEISRAFLNCMETGPARPGRNPLGWMAATGIAAAILLVIVLGRRPAETLAVHPPSPPPAPMIAYERPVSEKPARRAAPKSIPKPQWSPVEPTVEVVLPADALFPPGAVPAGFSFIADVRFQQ
jgi:hypothetical protein